MVNANFYSVLAQQAPSRDTLLLSDIDGRRYYYGDLERESARFAVALRALGLQAGDRVTVQIEKSVANLWLYLGVLRAGLVFHPLNTAYTCDEVRFFLSDAEPGLLVCDPSKLAVYEPLCQELGVSHVLSLDSTGLGSFTDYAGNFSADFATEHRDEDELAVLLYSSGTTGRPKGIMLTHSNLRSNAEVLVSCWGFTDKDVLLHVLPVFHVHGLFVAVHCVLMSGASMHWLPSFDAEKVQALLPASTVMMGVPTYYTRLLAEPTFGREDCRNMRVFISGSAPLLPEVFQQFQQRSGHTLLERYGMSETGMNSSNPLSGERRPGTVGLPLPGTAIRVCDSEHNPLPNGQIGEIQVRGENVFRGYWRMPEKTAADFTADGWFITGDQGRIDGDGYLSIVGRSKDMVISGGLNVYPKEVETALNDLPGIRESAVFGVPHPDFGEAVVATLVAAEDCILSIDDIRAMLEAQLAKFKVPKRIQFVSDLPRNTMGKVQKNLLRQEWNEPF